MQPRTRKPAKSICDWSDAAFVLLVPIFAVSACHKQVVIRDTVPEVGKAQKVQWLCEPDQQKCMQGGTVNDAMWNQSGTTRFPMADCEHGIAQILIERANRKHPLVYVVCKDADEDVSGGTCPHDQPKVPDIENGGLKCPDA